MLGRKGNNEKGKKTRERASSGTFRKKIRPIFRRECAEWICGFNGLDSTNNVAEYDGIYYGILLL